MTSMLEVVVAILSACLRCLRSIVEVTFWCHIPCTVWTMCTFRNWAWNVWDKKICNFWQFCWRLSGLPTSTLRIATLKRTRVYPPPPPPQLERRWRVHVQRMNGYTNHWSLSRGYCVLSKTMVSLFDWQENVQMRSNVSVQAFYFKMADRCTPSFTISLSNSLLSVATETVLKIVEFYVTYKTDTKMRRTTLDAKTIEWTWRTFSMLNAYVEVPS